MKLVYMVLPPPPAEGELTDEALERIAGGGPRHTPTSHICFLSDPHVALGEAGIKVPAGKTVKVVENTQDTVHLVLPPPLAEGELTNEALDEVAGGVVCRHCRCT
jgi:hypothetical protein